MRPKDLKFPYSWDERKPAYYKGVFIVPQYYQDHHLWEDEEEIFSSKKPFHIEYCSGNGDWILEKAAKNPDQTWIAVEKKFERVQKIWSKMQNRSITNLMIVCGEGLTFTRHYMLDASIQEAFVNFPDPWPKDRHAKHRIIQKPFIDELARTVTKGGKATYVTDDGDYSHKMITEMNPHKEWQSKFPSPYYTQQWENYGNSWFESLWKEKGRNIYYMQFERI